MRFCYAHRRYALYPDSRDSWNLAPADYTETFLKRAKAMGFDAIEVGVEVLEKTGGSEQQVKAFGRRLRDAGMPIGCVRAGGTLRRRGTGLTTGSGRPARSSSRGGWARRSSTPR